MTQENLNMERRVIDMALKYAIDNRDKDGIRDVIQHVKYRMVEERTEPVWINEPENDKE